jgi:uncharacterized membrane protein
MTLFQLFVALLPVHRLSTLEEAQATVTFLLAALVFLPAALILLLTMISLLVLAILLQLVYMQILHAPPVPVHPCNKLSEEVQASTMVTMSAFLFITRPVMVLTMHTTTTVEAPDINI